MRILRWFELLWPALLVLTASGLLVVRALSPSIPNLKTLDSKSVPLIAPVSKVLPGTFSLVGSEFRVDVPNGARLALTTGSSMYPLSGEGHLVVYVPVNVKDLRVGDFVVFYACSLRLEGLLFFHQLVEVTPASEGVGWSGVTKGIANHETDACVLTESDIVGKAFLIVWGN